MRVEITAQNGGDGGGSAGGGVGCWSGGDFSSGDVEDCVPAVGGFRLLRIGGGGWWWWGCGDGEEGAFVGFGVADEGGDVWVGEEGVGEDFRWGEREAVYAFAGEGDLGEVG